MDSISSIRSWLIIGSQLAQYIGRFYNEKNMDEIFPNQIQLFKSVFKGREDVFAVRWEKESKSGYMPYKELKMPTPHAHPPPSGQNSNQLHFKHQQDNSIDQTFS